MSFGDIQPTAVIRRDSETGFIMIWRFANQRGVFLESVMLQDGTPEVSYLPVYWYRYEEDITYWNAIPRAPWEHLVSGERLQIRLAQVRDSQPLSVLGC